MLTLRDMSEAEIRILYTFRMTRDFPLSELKTLSAILNLRERGEYDVIEARENGEFIAYALVYRPREGRVLLLDYLAVEPDKPYELMDLLGEDEFDRIMDERAAAVEEEDVEW